MQANAKKKRREDKQTIHANDTLISSYFCVPLIYLN